MFRRAAEQLPAPPGGFVDLHSHVIPGIDDGPEGWDESMEMLRRAARGGTSMIVATPHGDSRALWTSPEELRQACHRLNAALQREEAPLLVLLGMENPLEPRIVQGLKDGSALPLNGSDFVLVEFPFTELPVYWEEVLFQLQLQGKRPIIAHPERQTQIQQNPNLLASPVARGILAQITAGSLTARFGSQVRKTAEALVRNSLAQIIASDTHAAEGPRNPDLLEGFNAAARIVGSAKATEMMSTLPRSIVTGAGIPRRPPAHSLDRGPA